MLIFLIFLFGTCQMFFLDAATSGFLFQKEYDFEYALILYATTISDW